MKFNIDESKIVKIVIDGDNDNLIGFDIKDGNIVSTTIIPKKAPKVYTPGASVLDKEIDRELINKSHDIAAKIKELRGDAKKEKSISDEIKDAIKDGQLRDAKPSEAVEKKVDEILVQRADESKKIMDALETDDFKKSGVTFSQKGKTMALMDELKEEAEKDFEETWNDKKPKNNETIKDVLKENDTAVKYGARVFKTPSFQEGVTEKEQQILDIVSETPVDKLGENEELLKKIGEYKNLMKSKITKAEAAKNKNLKSIFNGELIDTEGHYGKPGTTYPRQ